MKLPTIDKETVEEHLKEIEEAEKNKKFKKKSNDLFGEILKENMELTDIVIPTLESDKSEDYKAGYLAGFTTIYSVLKKQVEKK